MFVSSIIIIVIIIILILMNTIKFIVTLPYYQELYKVTAICQLLPFEQYNLSELTAGSDLLFLNFMVN